MYKTGDLTIISKPCPSYDMEDGFCSDHDYGEHTVADSRRREIALGPAVYLPHSCDSWVIGGPEQIRTMIDDLQKVLIKLEGDK